MADDRLSIRTQECTEKHPADSAWQARRSRDGHVIPALGSEVCELHSDYPAGQCPICVGTEVRRG